MKELSIEEKAKAYDEAKARMSRAWNDNRCTIGFMNEIFPELKKSEDERIRKGLIEYFLHYPDHEITYYGLKADFVIAWLEKQGEHANFRNKIQIGDKVTRNEDGVLVNLSQLKRVAKKDEKQDEQKPYGQRQECVDCQFNYVGECKGSCAMKRREQKPAWSEEDEQMFEHIIEKATLKFSEWNCLKNDEINFLKSLKERVQPKREWSEEDRLHYMNVLEALEYVKGCKSDYDKIEAAKSDIAWFKFLKDRYTWKPSDEQMKALDEARSLANNCGEESAFDLRTLHEQLKKLREELL